MGQDKKEMSESGLGQYTLRDYFLGTLKDETIHRLIERKSLLEDNFVEELLIVENQLIEDYLDDILDESQRKCFEEFYLSSPDRRRQMKITRYLRKYAMKAEPQIAGHTQKAKPNFFKWRRLVLSPAPSFAAIFLIVAGFGIWWAAYYQSDADKGLAQLHLAYRGQRLMEARTTLNVDYVPLENMRGETQTVDEKALKRATSLLYDSTDNSARSSQTLGIFYSAKYEARSRHALGLLYLAQKEYDKSLAEFRIASDCDPNDAVIYSDIGAAYLAKAKQGKGNEHDYTDKGLEDLALSLKNIQRALELNESLLDALFNKALVLEEMNLPPQAQEAWQKYLEKDSVSPWADEARQKSEAIKPVKSKKADEILQDFLAAYEAKDHDKAYLTVSLSREMVTGKLVPQQLIFLFLTAPDEKKNKYLQALQYVGRLEKEKSNDPFFYEIADFYSRASKEKLEILKGAYDALRKGYEFSQLGKNKSAFEPFSTARRLFDQAGNRWEVMLSDYWIAYCESYSDHIRQSSAKLSELADLCEKKNYKWLAAQVYYWLATNENSLKEPSKALRYSELSLKFSGETTDFYNTKKTYSQMAEFQINVKQYREALVNMAKVMPVINIPEYSERQKWRDLDRIARLFLGMEIYDAAAAYETEAFALSQNQIKDMSFERVSLATLGRIYGAQKKYEDAEAFAERGRQVAEKLPEPENRQKGIGFALLQLAALKLERNNIREARDYYEQTAALYSSMEFKLYRYEAARGRLLCYLAENDDEAIQRIIPEILQMFEKNRNSILEEQSRDTFFDKENDIYDLIINYEYNRGNYERAFDYAESSRSRSLLDLQKNDWELVFQRGIPWIVFDENTVVQPLALADIRPRLPEQVQLVYYSVLPDKVLIWLIAKDKFETFSYKISSQELGANVSALIEAIKLKDDSKQRELSYLLYRILFKPVEDRLDAGKDTFLIPDKILFHLPFAALISDKTQKYLVAGHRLGYAPSANMFLISSENAGNKAHIALDREKLLSIGNPVFDKREFPGLEPLPSAAKESRNIAEHYPGATILLTHKATKQSIKENISQADVVQLAAHYVTNERSSLLSSFAVSGAGTESRWANYEMLDGKLEKPRLIILSACQTGIEHYYNGEGMIGAGRTFLALGVPLVVSSQWGVETSATAELMEKFHRLRKKENLSTLSALQQAQLEMLNNSDSIRSRPFYWAGFITLGGHAQF